jgi:Mu transposase, C-terminal domain
MVTDRQVRLLRSKRMEGKTLEVAAAAAGMSERTARAWQRGAMPSATKKERTWRTRPDPFAEVWSSDVEPLLRGDEGGRLQATTIIDHLIGRYPGRFEPGQVRTLQRHLRRWRAMHGPEREVFFPQAHQPGFLGSLDFTHTGELKITIAGVAYVHLLFQFVMAWSGWRHVAIALGETYEALLSGLQGALWSLGGVPRRVRLDNMSAATHELVSTGGRTLTRRFAHVVDHYDFEASRIEPGEAHQNGIAEKAHDLLKTALDQALIVRGSRDFATIEAYLVFVREIVERRFHRGREAAISEERAALAPLPAHRLPEYTRVSAKVRRWSTVHVAGRVYSVPSRLIGHEVDARVHPDVVEIWLGGSLLETMPRLRGDQNHRIDYRHVIWSLVRKPGAFAAYRYREDLFPTVTFRRAYDALRVGRGDRADVEYVRILHLAASTSESAVERALVARLAEHAPFDYVAVKALAQPAAPEVPHVEISVPDLRDYDHLIVVDHTHGDAA